MNGTYRARKLAEASARYTDAQSSRAWRSTSRAIALRDRRLPVNCGKERSNWIKWTTRHTTSNASTQSEISHRNLNDSLRRTFSKRPATLPLVATTSPVLTTTRLVQDASAASGLISQNQQNPLGATILTCVAPTVSRLTKQAYKPIARFRANVGALAAART